jgi:SAM-dependent methyltransferase
MTSNATSVQDYWDKHSDLFGEYYKNPTWFDRTFRKAIFLRAMIAIDVCKELPSPSVLDIGSGPGINSVAMVKKGGASRLVGIDFAPSMIELARTYAGSEGVAERCEFVEGDFMKRDLGTFDLAVALGVFDYIGDAQAFLKKMRSVARKAIVASWPENGLRMMLRKLRYTCPVYSYTEAQIRALHDKAGAGNVELIKIPGGWVSKVLL